MNIHTNSSNPAKIKSKIDCFLAAILIKIFSDKTRGRTLGHTPSWLA